MHQFYYLLHLVVDVVVAGSLGHKVETLIAAVLVEPNHGELLLDEVGHLAALVSRRLQSLGISDRLNFANVLVVGLNLLHEVLRLVGNVVLNFLESIPLAVSQESSILAGVLCGCHVVGLLHSRIEAGLIPGIVPVVRDVVVSG